MGIGDPEDRVYRPARAAINDKSGRRYGAASPLWISPPAAPAGGLQSVLQFQFTRATAVRLRQSPRPEGHFRARYPGPSPRMSIKKSRPAAAKRCPSLASNFGVFRRLLKIGRGSMLSKRGKGAPGVFNPHAPACVTALHVFN